MNMKNCFSSLGRGAMQSKKQETSTQRIGARTHTDGRNRDSAVCYKSKRTRRRLTLPTRLTRQAPCFDNDECTHALHRQERILVNDQRSAQQLGERTNGQGLPLHPPQRQETIFVHPQDAPTQSIYSS